MELYELKILLHHPDQLKIEVEKLRSDNTQLEEIKGFISLYDAFDGDASKVKDYLEQTEFSIKNAIPKKRKSISILKYAAVFLVFVGITTFIFNNSRKNNEILNQKTLSKNIYRDPGIPIYMSRDTKINWGELMFAIENESPEKAIQVWEKNQKNAPENDTLLYYGGIVYRNSSQSRKANFFFNENLKIQSVFNEQSLYFIAIYQWEQGNKVKARNIFTELQHAKNLDIKQAASFHLKEIK